MVHTRIFHYVPKKVYFRDGTTCNEYYIHIHAQELAKHLEKDLWESIISRAIPGQVIKYGSVSWGDVVTTDGKTLDQVANEMYHQLLNTDALEFSEKYSTWSGNINRNGLYLNFRLREII